MSMPEPGRPLPPTRYQLVLDLVHHRPSPVPTAVRAEAPAYDYLVGEKIWQEIMGDWY